MKKICRICKQEIRNAEFHLPATIWVNFYQEGKEPMYGMASLTKKEAMDNHSSESPEIIVALAVPFHRRKK